MSWVEGKSSLVAFGRIATKQLRNVTLSATMSDYRQPSVIMPLIMIYSRQYNLLPGHHKRQTQQLHAIHSFARTLSPSIVSGRCHPNSAVALSSSTLHLSASGLLEELNDDSLVSPASSTVPDTTHNGCGCADDTTNWTPHEMLSSHHSFSQIRGPSCYSMVSSH
jgi:hypothetical protein